MMLFHELLCINFIFHKCFELFSRFMFESQLPCHFQFYVLCLMFNGYLLLENIYFANYIPNTRISIKAQKILISVYDFCSDITWPVHHMHILYNIN